MAKKKKILFIHQNFPAQYRYLAPALAKEKDIEVFSISQKDSSGFSNIQHNQYEIKERNVPNLNRLSIEFETKMIRAMTVSNKCLEMKNNGFIPDLIIAHPGWGESFLLKEIWPDAKFLNYLEFYYNTKDSDIDFDLEESQRPEYGFDLTTKLVARNAPHLSSYIQADKLITPTDFQKSTAPKEFHNKITVIHDGIDTDFVKPKKDPFIILQNNKDKEEVKLTKKDKVITFVNRNLEPYRGYHIFIRSLPAIIEKHPDAYILIVGGNEVSYGAKPKDISYKDLYFNEIKNKIPENHRIRFLGKVPYNVLLNMFNICRAHIYYTYPFVLSWSMLEAMAMEALIVGSKTKPVEEVLKHNKNGLLLDFFDHELLSETVNSILSNPDKYKKLKKAARETIVKDYDLVKKCLPDQITLIRELLK